MRARVLSLVAALVAALALAPAAPAQEKAPPDISAPSAILIEAATGDVLYERAAEKRRPIASTTKLMTALLTMEHAELGDIVPAANYFAAPIESKLSLRPGEELSVADLLRGLMLESANDAAVTLAEHVSGSRAGFVRLMNRRARELKLRNTHFDNPIGFDGPGNYSSAHDLARLAVVLRKHSFIRKIANRTSATLTTGARPRTIRNRNTLLAKDRAVNGLKTGHTNTAGYVLVGTRRKNRIQLVSVVLGTGSMSARDADSLALLKWGEGFYHVITPVDRGVTVAQPTIEYRPGATLDLVTSGSVRRTVRSDAKITVNDVDVPDMVTGPIASGQQFGYREVFADGKRIAAVPIVSKYFVPAADFPQRAKHSFTQLPALIIALAVLGGTVMVARRLRRGPRRRPPRSEPEAA
jgi:D-alanyl-D-alanine carboxypeptidase (penicillin-binding protein 5/6)